MYSEELSKLVEELYPDEERLKVAVTLGSRMVGRYLDDLAPRGLSNREILAAKSLEQLQLLARDGLRKEQLYEDFMNGHFDI